MKTLRESLLDTSDVELNLEPIIKIDNWCKNNIRGTYEIDEKTLIINSPSSIAITNYKLTEFPSYIRFGTVRYGFYCKDCRSLTSLEGAPKEVGGSFVCRYCSSLASLEGAPKEVGGDFYCDYCSSLKSLEGAPKEVGGDFYCDYCSSLKSLEGSQIGRAHV